MLGWKPERLPGEQAVFAPFSLTEQHTARTESDATDVVEQLTQQGLSRKGIVAMPHCDHRRDMVRPPR